MFLLSINDVSVMKWKFLHFCVLMTWFHEYFFHKSWIVYFLLVFLIKHTWFIGHFLYILVLKQKFALRRSKQAANLVKKISGFMNTRFVIQFCFVLEPISKLFFVEKICLFQGQSTISHVIRSRGRIWTFKSQRNFFYQVHFNAELISTTWELFLLNGSSRQKGT